MPIKLLALDLDGTIVADLHTIPDRIQTAVKATTERGVHVTIATGRGYSVTDKFVRVLDLTTPIICYQGALIYDPQSGEIIANEGLPLPLAHRLVDLARSHNLALILFLNNKAYLENSTTLSQAMLGDIGIPLMVVNDLKQVTTSSPLKGMIVLSAKEAGAVVAQLRTALGDHLNVFRSLDRLIEVTSPNVSKGHALATLADYLNIDRSEVMAIGDQDNDIEMIAWAGVGIAMGNGSTGAKAAADHIAPSISQEGAVWAIERFILRQSFGTPLRRSQDSAL